MKQATFPHDLDLGPPVEAQSLMVLMQGNRDSELVRGILQALRNQAANLERCGRQTPKEANNPLEWRAYHAGGADATEELLMALWAFTQPAAQEGAAEQDSAS